MDLLKFLLKNGESFGFPISLADSSKPDLPLIYVNTAFLMLAGYDLDEVLGRNCRFLQNDKEIPEVRGRIRSAIKFKKAICQDLKNYRKNGELFFNRLVLLPIASQQSGYFLGFQHEISEDKYSPYNETSSNEILHNLINPMSVLLSLPRDDEDFFKEAFLEMNARIKDYIFKRL